MALTATRAAELRADEHQIKIEMIHDYLRGSVIVRGRKRELRAEVCVSYAELREYPAAHVELAYSRASHQVIDQILATEQGEGMSSQQQINRLELELAKYKDTVKRLSFQLEMSSRGGMGSVLKEDEVRRLALDQAAEHLMDHGVITTGSELVEVCEQIKKLQRHDMKLPEGTRTSQDSGVPF